jgi:hypothetical protein
MQIFRQNVVCISVADKDLVDAQLAQGQDLPLLRFQYIHIGTELGLPLGRLGITTIVRAVARAISRIAAVIPPEE